MDRKSLRDLMTAVQAGTMAVDAALDRLRDLPYEDLGFARLDHHRALRRGQPEVIFCPGKTPGQIAQIAARLAEANPCILATRAAAGDFAAVREVLPQAVYHEAARVVQVGRPDPLDDPGHILVVAAGTADLPVAEEATVVSVAYGHETRRLYDVGVAGLHRLLGSLDTIRWADVLIVAAGMDGALPSVVGGLASQPVIALPTSVGYGASFGGLAALLSMLNSCAAGVAVVNIDNGFGAARLADSILGVRRRAVAVGPVATDEREG